MTESIIHTYSAREVTISLKCKGENDGEPHMIHGYAEDSFVSISFASDGISKRVGCDGEVVRSILPDETYNVQLNVLQTSSSNRFLNDRFWLDRGTGRGMFQIQITDNYGGMIFECPYCWIAKPADHGYGREAQSRQWTLQTSAAMTQYYPELQKDYSEFSAIEASREAGNRSFNASTY